ncbi:adenosine deaminase [Aquipuribacter nitratireducens]|uniref:adenosine deaminase n=1 Tax=Aquipuribacter nitratireducens TaxID=650104 RepID=A0ABW0GM31_9MICO
MTVDLRQAPKVLLHDHLDGGLRPQTLVELADGIGHALPATEPGALATWFVESAESGSLERYLETFAHTVAVLQTEEALERVAAEAVLDLAADGVVHAEVRYAPELCTGGGLALEAVVEAVQAGFARGVREAAAQGATTSVGTLLCAMRQADNHMAAARLAVRYRDAGVVGFDIAGPEAGFPPSRQKDAFDLLRAELVPFTVHAGEAAGLDSVADALSVGTLRLGHGVRVADDVVAADAPGGAPTLGRLAAWVRDRRVPLEASPTSNVQTGAATSIAAHPATLLKDLGFAVTVNTDNRLVSGTSTTQEMTLLREQAGWSDADLALASVAAAEAAFLPLPEREALVLRVRDGWAALT